MRARLLAAGNSLVLTALCSCASLPPSKAISNHVGFNLINSTNTTIADLAASNSGGSDHQITTHSESRIMVSAQVNITNPAGVAVRGSCQLLINDGSSPGSQLTVIGRPSVWFTTANPAYNLAVPVLGYVDKPAGKYNVVVQCQQLATVGSTVAVLDNMIVWTGQR